jgi:flagellar L-ring protein precursor FlgH
MNIHIFIRCSIVLLAIALSGCAHFESSTVAGPTTMRPAPASAAAAPTAGAIYSASTYRPMFEDRRARLPGDTLVVLISERSNASQRSSSNVNRSGSVEFGVTAADRVLGGWFEGAKANAKSANKFEGGGGATAGNDFTGTITATVLEVLPNGNLLIAGDKRVTLNHGSESIRISGVVNPNTVSAANTVASSQIADARIEMKNKGQANEAQVMGWMARFFLSALPF